MYYDNVGEVVPLLFASILYFNRGKKNNIHLKNINISKFVNILKKLINIVLLEKNLTEKSS
jgi:hypothetical protein